MGARPLIAACAAATALAAAGCGGRGDDDAPDGKLARKDLAARASDVCRDYTKKAKALDQPKGGDQSAAAGFFADAAKIAADQHGALAKLEPAADVKPDWDAFLSLDAEGAAALKRLADAAKGKASDAGAEALSDLSSLDTRLNGAARKLGASACGSGA